MKTIVLWNVPVETARIVVNHMRETAAAMVMNGAPIEEVNDLLFDVKSIEEAIAEAKEECEEK